MTKRFPSRKILIIDDDKDLCDELKEILEEEGYSVETEYDGLAGRKRLDKEDFDVLLLDLRLPGVDGETILRDVRENSLCPRVVVLTGKPLYNPHAEPGEEQTTLPEPLDLADRVINKPFEIKELLEAVDR